MEITKKTIEVQLSFYGSDHIQQLGPGSFRGGVPDPEVGGELGFSCWREIPDENGMWNPPIGEDTVEGGFQVSIAGTAEAYRELGRYLLAIAELDTGAHPDFHEHHEAISEDGRTRLHVIVRKTPSGVRTGSEHVG